MASEHITELEAAFGVYRSKLNSILDSSAAVCRSGSVADIRSSIQNLKSTWRDFSGTCLALKALRRSSDDIVGAGMLKAERKVMAGNIESVVCLLNQSLRDTGVELESEFNNSVSSSLSLFSFEGEEKSLDPVVAPNSEPIICGNLRSCNLRKPEHVLLEQERTSGRLFQKWLRQSLQTSPTSVDDARACWIELKHSFNWRKRILSELIDFHLRHGEVTFASSWKERLRLDEDSFYEVRGHLGTQNISRCTNPFLPDFSSSGSFSGFNQSFEVVDREGIRSGSVETSQTPDQLTLSSIFPSAPAVSHCSAGQSLGANGEMPTSLLYHATSAGSVGPRPAIGVPSVPPLIDSATPTPRSFSTPLTKHLESMSTSGLTDFFEDFVDKYDAGLFSIAVSATTSDVISSYSSEKSCLITTTAGINDGPRVHFSNEFGNSNSALPHQLSNFSPMGRVSQPLTLDATTDEFDLPNTSVLGTRLPGRIERISAIPPPSVTSSPRLSRSTSLLRNSNPSLGAVGPMQDWTYTLNSRAGSCDVAVNTESPHDNSDVNIKAGSYFGASTNPLKYANHTTCSREHVWDTGYKKRLQTIRPEELLVSESVKSGGNITSGQSCDRHEEKCQHFPSGTQTKNALECNKFQRNCSADFSSGDANLRQDKFENPGKPSNHSMILTNRSADDSSALGNIYPYQVILETELLRGRGDKFTGMVEDYVPWRDRMLECIHRAGSSERATMEIILANTEGSAQRVVRQLLRSRLPPSLQVKRLWAHFEARCGSGMLLSKSQLDWLRKFPRISSPTEVDRMDELLTFCYSISEGATSSSGMTYLLSPEGQREVWEKMPEPFVERWRRSCSNFRRGGTEPTMDRLIAAISDYVEERADPYFVDRTCKQSKNPVVLRTETKSDLLDEPVYCPMHKIDGHRLADCRQFLKLAVPLRWDALRKLELCFLCFGSHMARTCTSNKTCRECHGSHHELLHSVAVSEPNSNRVSGQSMSNCARLCSSNETTRSCSKTLPVQVRLAGQDNFIRCLCILDEQSNTSFCDAKLLDMLKLDAVEEEYTVSTMSGLKSRLTGAIIEGLQVKGEREDTWIQLPQVRSHPALPDTSREIATRDIVHAHSHLRRLAKHFPKCISGLDVLLLVGTDCGPAMRTEVFGSTYPFAHHTALGWSLVGPACVGGDYETKRCLRTSCINEHYNIQSTPIQPFHQKGITSFDTFKEMKDDNLPGLSQEDQQFIAKIGEGTRENDSGHLEFPLPLRDQTKFTNNKRPVFLRTRNSLCRIMKKPLLAERCAQAMGQYIAAGHVEQLKPESEPPDLVNYIPVMPVEHPKKGKVRIVFDSSASYGGCSLNDNLLRGPDINNCLLGVLLRFRLFRVAFTSDVECMFHCFYVHKEHRNLLRFFWWEDNTPGERLAIFRANVHVFGNRSSPAVAAYGLRHVTTLPGVDAQSPQSRFIKENFYVDDGMGSVESDEQAISLLRGARELLSRFNIRLHKIVSSSTNVLRAFPPSEIAQDVENVDICCPLDHTALGLKWEVHNDEISVRYTNLRRPFTKRGILSLIQSIFDPLGMVSPVVLAGRLLQRSFIAPLKESCPFHEYGWDDPLPSSALLDWEKWVFQLKDIKEIKIPRCYTPHISMPLRTELHIFSDASSVSIGFVAYIRRVDSTGTVGVGFALASSKVSPRAATSIPRLELCAAAEAAHASQRLEEELSIDISQVYFYTDSKVVVGYIQNRTKAFTRYVTARVKLILSVSNVGQWNYIPSTDNPADIACRPRSVTELSHSIWFQGPPFLRNRDLPGFASSSDEVALPEVVSNPKCLFVHREADNSFLGVLQNPSRSWLTMIRVVAWVWRFIRRCRHLSISLEEANKISIIALVKFSQAEGFPREVESLKRSGGIPENWAISPLAPFIDGDGLIRVGGRLANADLPYEEKHPILLPPHHFITMAILCHFHEKCIHQGRLITMSFLRRAGYHIHNQKSIVGKFLKNCVICRKLRGKPETQFMADLPADRLEKTPPFSHSGVDVFGHYLVHDGKGTRRTSASKKIWVVLFTCLFCRAVHVEILGSLDSATFQLALRRFTAIRGECKLFRSDRGTNFVGLENQKMSVPEIEQLLYPSEVFSADWKFLPPGASHFAGVWERKIGSIKRILDISLTLLGPSSLSREEFATLIQEAASIVNHTPLGDISSDPNDPFPVSPSSLLTLREGPVSGIAEFSESDLQQYGRKRWRRVQYLAEQFWLRWRRDFLRSADRRRKWKVKRRSLEVGDVVLIRDKAPRGDWPMGLIIETYPDRNGFVRRVSLRRKVRGIEKCKVVERAISDLVLLIPVPKS